MAIIKFMLPVENTIVDKVENMAEEIWKVIPDYPDYQISNYGKIKSLKRGKDRILRPYTDGLGRLNVILYRNGKRVKRMSHALTYEVFNNYKRKKNECIHHIDENVNNNYISNLKIMDVSEHSYIHNIGNTLSEETRKRMSMKSNKFKGYEIWLIKKILASDYYKNRKISHRFIGKMFKVKESVISHIKHGRHYNYINYP